MACESSGPFRYGRHMLGPGREKAYSSWHFWHSWQPSLDPLFQKYQAKKSVKTFGSFLLSCPLVLRSHYCLDLAYLSQSEAICNSWQPMIIALEHLMLSACLKRTKYSRSMLLGSVFFGSQNSAGTSVVRSWHLLLHIFNYDSDGATMTLKVSCRGSM